MTPIIIGEMTVGTAGERHCGSKEWEGVVSVLGGGQVNKQAEFILICSRPQRHLLPTHNS